ncbi:D-alanine--poly(phosphoribitol) ligase subunit DltA [Neobacillus massiliamazoniensis]|uniref:D-alanine--D-alanyl carrier protein ligase n=1 Tax=Neobacillus massiliamazoniensis TaxID=1499688 RepID=A0A0U1P1K4_9BACI|nr:D-alanine--poly(phosphoribitol) ligase subunit DltA [Neobacillus massiliamazoniensis]CRK84008.1 D-alanine--poly(phosphoribitol) ligase subunit 1 [Neobacillus massiliamazoniensis]
MRMLSKIKDFAFTHPEANAFISPNKEITYGDLWRQSEQVARYILKQNIGSGSPIIVYGHMEPEILVCFLGSVKSGHAYIPIDISIPFERIDRICKSSEAELLINVSGQPMPLENSSIRMITFEDVEAMAVDSEDTDAEKWVKEDENFYIIYTSGSTGNPKGVQISVNNLQSFVDWMTEDFPITGGLRFLNQAPFSFDLSVMDLFPSLATGGSLFAITKEMIARPKILFEALKKSDTQVWTSTPSFVQMCLMDPSFKDELLPNLTVFLFCGEVLPVRIAHQLMERFPKAKVYNTYGPTEATVAITFVEVTKEMLTQYEALPVGKAKKDIKLLLLNEDGREVPEGEKGEIIIIGPSVSKGYLGQPELTEKAFTTINGERAYRTGDEGYLEKELLFYKGRRDFQIKLHGYRMELEEIEQHIAKSSLVKAVVVIPVYKGDKIESLTAAIVPAKHDFEKEYQLTGVIKKELAEKLPAYMIPKRFTFYQELPMTPNGKIDRKQIREKVIL